MNPQYKNPKTYNLRQLNAFKEEHSSNSRILDSVNYDLMEYIRYIESSKEFIQKQDSIKISLKKQTPKEYLTGEEYAKALKEHMLDDYPDRFYLQLCDNLPEKEEERINQELFEKEVRVYSEIPSGNRGEDREIEIRILYSDKEEGYLVLDTQDNLNAIYIKADTYQLEKQIEALYRLKEKPATFHEPLLRLFSNFNPYFEESYYYSIEIAENEWFILTDTKRDGTYEQREFVLKALRSNDFALMEGPPGSGKTTVIIELILQLAKRGKRVLLCSATHVAIDNVLDRILGDYKEKCQGLVLPIRIASRKDQIRKESVKSYWYPEFAKQKKKEMKEHISGISPKKVSHQIMMSALNGETKEDKENIDQVILDGANLVAGTMIGILQHPNIRKMNELMPEPFDVMIVDEASKATFPDFIIPALHAKKWILVGDVKQLSPYIEDDYVEYALSKVVEEKTQKELTLTFEIKKQMENCKKQGVLPVLISNEISPRALQDYNCVYVNGRFQISADNILKLNTADWILCENNKESIQIIEQYIFVKVKVFEGSIRQSDFTRRQDFWHKRHRYIFENRDHTWAEMLASRLSQQYQYRKDAEFSAEIENEIALLTSGKETEIEKIRRVAMPSILELLQEGIGKTFNKDGIELRRILYNGFNQNVKSLKFLSLTYQHRMEDKIAETSREHFYDGQLATANKVFTRINPLKSYKSDESVVVWVNNNDESFRRRDKYGKGENINPTEVSHIQNELSDFVEYAMTQNGSFDVAIITFYKRQEKELRKMLQRFTGQRNRKKNFSVSNDKIKIKLHTVDEFQGDEADLVLLSFTLFKPKAFYNSPNRLNVALTRARYKLVLFGNAKWLQTNAPSEALRYLAAHFPIRQTTQHSNSFSNKYLSKPYTKK